MNKKIVAIVDKETKKVRKIFDSVEEPIVKGNLTLLRGYQEREIPISNEKYEVVTFDYDIDNLEKELVNYGFSL